MHRAEAGPRHAGRGGPAGVKLGKGGAGPRAVEGGRPRPSPSSAPPGAPRAAPRVYPQRSPDPRATADGKTEALRAPTQASRRASSTAPLRLLPAGDLRDARGRRRAGE